MARYRTFRPFRHFEHPATSSRPVSPRLRRPEPFQVPVRDSQKPVISQPCLYLLHGLHDRDRCRLHLPLSGLPDQVLLAHTKSLVLHEQALQLAVLDHLREIQARHLLVLKISCVYFEDWEWMIYSRVCLGKVKQQTR